MFFVQNWACKRFATSQNQVQKQVQQINQGDWKNGHRFREKKRVSVLNLLEKVDECDFEMLINDIGINGAEMTAFTDDCWSNKRLFPPFMCPNPCRLLDGSSHHHRWELSCFHPPCREPTECEVE